MGFLSKIKKFFVKKDKTQETPQEVISQDQTAQQTPQPIVKTRTELKQNCEICGKQIGLDRWTKQQGYWFHRSCFKKKLRESK